MKRDLFKTILMATVLCYSTISYAEYKKLAQTGFQFLSVETDARATGMAGAMTTVSMGSGSLFFNPACLALMPYRVDASLGQVNWIADIKYNSFSAAFKPLQGKIGIFGISALMVNYGNLQGTMVWPNDRGYMDTGIFSPSAFMVGVGYAKALSSLFAVGGQIKYAGQQLSESIVEIEDSLGVRKYIANAFAFDFGTHFKTGLKSLAFGMSIRNFSNEIKYETEGFQLPLTFSMGISMNLVDLIPSMAKSHSLIASVDAVHPRDFPEYINLGFEYNMRNMLFVRYGFMSNRDDRASNFGFGLKLVGVGVDYSYSTWGVFKDTQNFTLRFSL